LDIYVSTKKKNLRAKRVIEKSPVSAWCQD